MSKDMDDAVNKAYMEGRQAFRAGEIRNKDNPFPTQSPIHDAWDGGWEDEEAADLK
jgi:hypothetical protein